VVALVRRTLGGSTGSVRRASEPEVTDPGGVETWTQASRAIRACWPRRAWWTLAEPHGGVW